MSRIAGLADEKFDYELWAERLAELRMTDTATGAASVTDAMTMAASRATAELGITTILAISGTGFTVRSMARFRPQAQIWACRTTGRPCSSSRSAGAPCRCWWRTRAPTTGW